MNLSVSIVVFKSLRFHLLRTLCSLRRAASHKRDLKVSIFIVDNDSEDNDLRAWLSGQGFEGLNWISGQGNIGFGRAHNLVLEEVSSDFHLILNPDVDISTEGISNGLNFFTEHPECGLITPVTTDKDGQKQVLCKMYPTILDLTLRGFAPVWLKSIFSKRLDEYAMKGINTESVYWDPPIVSGCFMLFRTEVLKGLGGFDPRFFLYFEDFDLSLRASKITKVAYVPSVKIVHYGGEAARKGLKHIVFFVHSAVMFFNKHGWKIH
jgi:GT2 family glycosyltransferase